MCAHYAILKSGVEFTFVVVMMMHRNFTEHCYASSKNVNSKLDGIYGYIWVFFVTSAYDTDKWVFFRLTLFISITRLAVNIFQVLKQ